MVRVVESIIDFAEGFPLEFHSYCPFERWEKVLQSAGSGVHIIEEQLAAKKDPLMIPADSLFAIVDLEECASGARDARLSSAKLALIISAIGAVGESFLGLSWLGIPSYIISVAIVLGRPVTARVKEVPAAPFKPDTLQGKHLGDHTDKAKILERVIVAPLMKPQVHHWGTVVAGFGTPPMARCLMRDDWRVRVEGWEGDVVHPGAGWSFADPGLCETARNEIAVWSPCDESPRPTDFRPVPLYSGHEETYWVEYIGPMTDGECRRAGPFG